MSTNDLASYHPLEALRINLWRENLWSPYRRITTVDDCATAEQAYQYGRYQARVNTVSIIETAGTLADIRAEIMGRQQALTGAAPTIAQQHNRAYIQGMIAQHTIDLMALDHLTYAPAAQEG